MRDWRAGDLLSVAAGLAVLLSAGFPWVQVADPPAALGAIVLGMYEPFVLVVVIGVMLVVFGAMRTVWSGLVALGSTFGIAIALIMISEGAPQALAVYAPGLTGHGDGYGVATLLAAGIMAGAGGVVTAVQREPKVATRAVHKTELPARPSSS